MAVYTQTDRPLRFETAIGPDRLLASGFSGVEGISRPYVFQVDLLSEDPSLEAAELLRSPVLLSIVLPNGGERKIHGFVNRFVQLGQREELTAYQAEVVPWLWFLSLSRDCKVFQELNVLDIVAQVFQSYGYSDFEVRCTRDYPVREYCVQYRETHLDFVSRLLEEEGIFYYFEHSDSGHVLVLADSNGSVPVCPGLEGGIRVTAESDLGEDAIMELRREHLVHAGTVTLNHYDYLQPALPLLSSISGDGREEVYDFPGKYTTPEAGDRLARLRLEAAESRRHLIRGAGTGRAMQGGTRFEMREHYRADANQDYLLLEVRHHCVATSFRSWEMVLDYHNEFVAIPSSVEYRPPLLTPRPVVQGSQTAVVVGKAGEEIWTDKHGRVKVQFHWDRYGARDEKSSCWVRVATPWAGKGWGGLSVPRIGQEVVVDFLEGDPDQPLITGSVYNAEMVPPYDPGRGGVVSGLRSNTHKGKGYNELSMDDTAGSEKVTLHAQYDLATTVGHDESHTVKNNRTTNVQANDTETVGGDQTVKVEKNQAITVGQGQTVKVDGEQKVNVGAERAITVGASNLLGVAKDHEVSAGANVVITSGKSTTSKDGGSDPDAPGGAKNIVLSSAEKTMIKAGTDASFDAKGDAALTAGQEIVIVAQKSITLSAGGSTIEIGPGGIKITSGALVEITGMTVKIN